MKKIRPMWIYGDVFICDGLKCNLCGFVLFLFICGGAKLGFISFFIFDLSCGIFICGIMVVLYVIIGVELLIVEI